MAGKDTSSKEARAPGPELRLVDRRAFVGFPELKLAPGVVVQDFALQIPDVTFPLNVSGGAARYQKKKLDFGFLELTVDADVIHRAVQQLAGKLGELDDLKLHFRPGVLEAQARLRSADRTPVTFKIAFDGDGEKLAVYCYDVRYYAFSTTPASRLPALITEALTQLDVLPEVERRGANGFTTRLLPGLVEQAAVGRGYKMPALDQARLAAATVSSKGLSLRFTAGGLPPPAQPDEELLLALEGARAFADAEELLAQGKLAQAREAYLRLGDANEAHPFAAQRLLTILVADPPAHELALDIAASLSRRREQSATAMWAEAVVRERRGEFGRAAERYLALCSLARKNQEEASAFFAAEAAARASRDHAPQMAVKALHELLGLQPDHLPSLKALARASDQAKDRAGAIRAYRRLAALARDAADAADAHVQLARLSAQTEDDVAGARLHCEAALRLAPDHPEALLLLGELCFRSDEHLRAVKALDRLREVAMGRHEVDRVGRANLLAGQVWEKGLKQPENALLRYREAASMLPGEAEPLFFAARVADSLGKVQEAVAGYQQAIELAGPAPRTDDVRRAAHQSHHALARLLKTRLGEPARAREHLEAAFALDPNDAVALAELLPYFRAAGKVAELADACEKAAAGIDDPLRRAALWAEAGELYRARLAQPERAERLLSQALEADGKNRAALEGMLALAESRRDGGQLTRSLRALAELAEDPKDRVRHYRRLAVAARDLAFDLELAAHAYREVLKVEPDDLPVLGELCAIERRRGEMPGLAWALEARARAAEVHGDKRLAAATHRELGQVLDQRLGRSGEALVAFEKAARLFPEPNALLDLATLSMRLERGVNARRALEDVIALLPKHAPPEKLAEVRARLGRACELLGDKDAAREHYAMAFPLRRLDDELAQRLEALYLEGHFTRELTDLWAARAQALLQAGRAYDAAILFYKSAQSALAGGDQAGAMLRLNAALDAAPTGEKAAEAIEAMGQLELDRGEPADAARLYARRAQLADEPRAAARWLFRAAQLTQGTPREEQYLTAALEKDGTFILARLRRADLIEAANPREALVDIEAALHADPKDPDVAGAQLDPVALARRAGFAALKASQYDAARKHLAHYCALKPADLEAQLELVKLHRRAGALEPLVDLLGDVWPRLAGAARIDGRREYAEGCLSLGRTAAAIEALRSILSEDQADQWAAMRLLTLLPADDAHTRERAELVTRLLAGATGEDRAELLARRAELHRLAGNMAAARADLLEAAKSSARPLPLLRSLAELARQTRDDAAELAAWRLALDKARPEAAEDAGAVEAVRQDAAERVLAIARARAETDDRARALEAWELATTLSLGAAERFEAWFGLAASAKALGNLRRAEEALLEASQQGPLTRRVDALLERAKLLESRRANDDAVETYRAALALAPAHGPATDGLKRNLRVLEDWAGLAEVVAAAAEQAPRERAAALYAELATLYLERLHVAGPAEAALRQVVALDDGDVAARRKLAALLVKKGELGEATLLVEQAAAALPGEQAAPLLRDGAALANQAGDAELELKLMRRAHALAPAQGEDLARLSEALYLHGAVAEALPLQQQLAAAASFEDSPDTAEAVLLRLADLAEQSGDAALAEATLRTVVKERPLNERAVERLAALLGRRDPKAALELRVRHVEGLSASARTAERLLGLARDAAAQLGDAALAYRLFRRAAEASEAPLPIRLEAVALLRAKGLTAELMAELPEVAQLHLAQGELDASLAAWDEEARLAEGAGRTDEALRTLLAMAQVCEDEGRDEAAAAALVRRALLLRDSKLDLEGAEEALLQAWTLHQAPATARQGIELARRRGDRAAEIDWLERTLRAVEAPAERALGFVELARLHLGLPAAGGELATAPLLAPEQAEAALQQALQVVPGEPAAEALLLGLYERQDRVVDVAAYYEAAAARTRDVAERARLLLRAAELYQDRADRPAEAAAALLAARAARPDDLQLTARVADLLHQLGRVLEAADFDALLLEADPFHPAFERHLRFLRGARDEQAVAGLLSRRAERLTGEEAAAAWLAAAAAFRRAGATERAQLCEAQAFEASPKSDDAFTSLLARAKGDVRRQSELLATRAQAVPGEAPKLLKQRAELLTAAAEALLAAGAWDEYLALAPDDAAALEARAELAFAGGGARAAQPYDRKLLQAGGEGLPLATRLRTQLRLGQASLEAAAWRDAVDAFEQAWALDEDGPRGREALTLMSEAYARLRDPEGQYRSALRLARHAGPEAEALYRRAISLFGEPARAVEALEALLAKHPGEVELYEKGVAAYGALNRPADLAALHERFAAAAGGSRAAGALLAAAQVRQAELGQAERAFELRLAATELDPDNLEAVGLVVAELRRRGDPRLAAHLAELVARTRDEAEANPLRLELGALQEQAGRLAEARAALEPIWRRGPSASGYVQAVAALQRLLAAAGESATLAEVQLSAAELAGAEQQAALLLDAARSFQRAGDLVRAEDAARASLAARTSRDGFALLVELASASDDAGRLARALVQLAEHSEGTVRSSLLLDAARAWEAAGGTAEARELLERLLKEQPDLLPADEAGEWLARLGASQRAMDVAFAPAMAAGDFARALSLAEAADDQARVSEALWALAEKDGASTAAQRLAAQLRRTRDTGGLERLARAMDATGAGAEATRLWNLLYFTHHSPSALEALVGRGELTAVVNAAVASHEPEAVVPLLALAGQLVPAQQEALYEAVADTVPERRRAMLRELATLRTAAARPADAAEALAALANLEETPQARAAAQVERGELLLGAGDAAQARAAFERAVADDASQVTAVRRLVELSKDSAPERFVAMAERLGALAGAEAVAPWRPALAEAYLALGRPRDAYRELGALAETPELIGRRAALAEELGLTGEALALRERVAKPEELEAIFTGYLEAQLVPFAVRLGGKLLEEGRLSARGLWLLGERLAPTPQGAALAAKAWPQVLREQPTSADGWTLYAEALRHLGQAEAASLADGFGAVLTNTAEAAPLLTPRLLPSLLLETYPPVPRGLVPISEATMPRLAAALGDAMDALGAGDLDVALDPTGGVEAWLASEQLLVLGAGALAAFGQPELTFLVALALALGAKGRALRAPGAVDGLAEAAVTAFEVYPSSLAAGRVLAQLDEAVRGSDPRAVDVGAVLRGSGALKAVALRALEILRS